MDDEVERNPLLRRLAKKNLQSKAYRASPKLERGLAKKAGGYRTSASGSKKEKGDVRVRGIARLEHKATQNKSFSITREMVDKIENAAMLNDEVPAIVVAFLNERGIVDKELAVIPLVELLRLLSR